MPVVNKTLYLNADQTKVVDEGSEDAVFLLARKGTYLDDALAQQHGISGTEPEVYDAVADHEAKHGGESDLEAERARAATLEGEDDPDGPAAPGERGKLADPNADQAPQGDVKATDTAPQTKARTKAPENK